MGWNIRTASLTHEESWVICRMRRGNFSSVSDAADVLADVARRARQGHREVVLTGINLGCFRDRPAGMRLADLLRRLLTEGLGEDPVVWVAVSDSPTTIAPESRRSRWKSPRHDGSSRSTAANAGVTSGTASAWMRRQASLSWQRMNAS